MTEGEFKNLREGDIVQSKASGKAYIVTENFHNRVTAIRTVDITNPDEWDLIVKNPVTVQITSQAVEYLVHETGLEPGTAEELLQSVLTMCQVK
jgi:hypothetical protein